MSDEPTDFNTDGGAAFNIGLATAIEIRKLLNECNGLARVGALEAWYNCLLAVEREVRPEMLEEDKESLETSRVGLKDLFPKYQKNVGLKSELFNNLHLFEIELRRIIKKRGLGMPDRDSPGMALGG